jgi:hypothetical protein
MASFLESLFGLNQGGDTIATAKKNQGLVNQLDTTGTGYLTEAKGITDDYLNLGKSGATAYADALGLNGAGGSSAAMDRFTTSPGYDFALDQGLQALERRSAMGGRLNSGQNDIDLLQYGVKTANDEWDDWLDRLGGYNSMYTQGVGGATKSLGDLTTFKEGITTGLIDTNNQKLEGNNANSAGIGNLGKTIASIGGKLLGYGGF